MTRPDGWGVVVAHADVGPGPHVVVAPSGDVFRWWRYRGGRELMPDLRMARSVREVLSAPRGTTFWILRRETDGVGPSDRMVEMVHTRARWVGGQVREVFT